MKERPILFKGEMVRAILDGRKTQTRRIIKPQPYRFDFYEGHLCWDYKKYAIGPAFLDVENQRYGVCPYGRPGDHFWVRETFADTQGMGFDKRIHYSADTIPGSEGDQIRKDYGVKWKPSIFMPRWASRILLEITNVRVERLQEISESDSSAEGVQEIKVPGIIYEDMAVVEPRDNVASDRDRFQYIWEEINGIQSWDRNPWVWVIEFKLLHVRKDSKGGASHKLKCV